jgi:colanic acid biosynthesis glycosyl transferase WcaI
VKIVIHGINYAPELTGTGKYSGEMAEWLASRAHDVRVVTAPPYYPQWQVGQGYAAYQYKKEVCRASLACASHVPGESGRNDECGKLVVYRCPLWIPSKQSGLRRIIHLASFALSSFPVMLAQVFRRPDIVLVVEPPLFCSPAAILAARLAGGKAILHVQDFEVDAAFDMGLLRSQWLRRAVLTVERWLLRRFDKVSTISGRMLQRLDSKGVAADKQMLFPNWVDIDLIHPMRDTSPFRDELAIERGDVVLLYSGNMGQKQGLELIIESARLLEPDSHVRFVLCGQGAAYESLRSMADGLQNIQWLPLQPLEKLNELLNLADIHLLLQRADAADLVMPSKLTGMLASGRPVIATAAEGTEVWSVVEGRGINTPPGDVEAFSAAIRTLVDNADERVRLGQNGRKYAEENLSTDAVLEKFESELLELTDNSK